MANIFVGGGGRLKFSSEDDCKIVKHVIKEIKAAAKFGGERDLPIRSLRFWEEAKDEHVTDHSAESMKGRFWRILLPGLKDSKPAYLDLVSDAQREFLLNGLRGYTIAGQSPAKSDIPRQPAKAKKLAAMFDANDDEDEEDGESAKSGDEDSSSEEPNEETGKPDRLPKAGPSNGVPASKKHGGKVAVDVVAQKPKQPVVAKPSAAAKAKVVESVAKTSAQAQELARDLKRLERRRSKSGGDKDEVNVVEAARLRADLLSKGQSANGALLSYLNAICSSKDKSEAEKYKTRRKLYDPPTGLSTSLLSPMPIARNASDKVRPGHSKDRQIAVPEVTAKERKQPSRGAARISEPSEPVDIFNVSSDDSSQTSEVQEIPITKSPRDAGKKHNDASAKNKTAEVICDDLSIFSSEASEIIPAKSPRKSAVASGARAEVSPSKAVLQPAADKTIRKLTPAKTPNKQSDTDKEAKRLTVDSAKENNLQGGKPQDKEVIDSSVRAPTVVSSDLAPGALFVKQQRATGKRRIDLFEYLDQCDAENDDRSCSIVDRSELAASGIDDDPGATGPPENVAGPGTTRPRDGADPGTTRPRDKEDGSPSKKRLSEPGTTGPRDGDPGTTRPPDENEEGSPSKKRRSAAPGNEEVLNGMVGLAEQTNNVNSDDDAHSLVTSEEDFMGQNGEERQANVVEIGQEVREVRIVPAIIVEPPEASMSAVAKKIRPPGDARSATKRYTARKVNETLKKCAKLGLITTVDEWNKYEVELNHVANVHGKISSVDLPTVLKQALPAFVLTLKLAKKNGWSYEETIDNMDRKKIVLKRVKKAAPESLPPMGLFEEQAVVEEVEPGATNPGHVTTQGSSGSGVAPPGEESPGSGAAARSPGSADVTDREDTNEADEDDAPEEVEEVEADDDESASTEYGVDEAPTNQKAQNETTPVKATNQRSNTLTSINDHFQTPPTSPAANSLSPEFLTAPDSSPTTD